MSLNNLPKQSTLETIDTYFSAHGDPSVLRVNESGGIEVAGKFTLLFDRIADRIRHTFDKDYKPADWGKLARDAVSHKLTESLTKLMPGQTELVNAKVAQLMTNISHRLNNGNDITWRGALATELRIMSASDGGTAVSTATKLLLDIGKLTSAEIEVNVLKQIGQRNIEFARLTAEGQEKIFSIIKDSLSNELKLKHDLPWVNGNFGADVLMHAMINYQLSMPEAMKLLDIPATLMLKNGFSQRPDLQSFINEQIARTIKRETGAPLELARKNARNIEYCMSRYGVDWKQALDLAGFAGRFARANKKADSTTDNQRPLPVNMDMARAVQQVMSRDRCNMSQAVEIVERRIKALPRIKACLPTHANPSIASGMQCSINTSISESSKQRLSNDVKTLFREARDVWIEPASKSEIQVAAVFLVDAKRSMRLTLDNKNQVRYLDERNPEELISRIYEFAADTNVMVACCDSFNQTILGSILTIIQDEQGGISTYRSKSPHRKKNELLWHAGKRNDDGTITVRHLYLQQASGIEAVSSYDKWPVNCGAQWSGDVNPLNAGLALDFSYSFKEDDLKKGIRNPEILECRYSFNLSLDWDSIDQKLAQEESLKIGT